MGYKFKILEPNFELKLFLIDELWCVPEVALYPADDGPHKVVRPADGAIWRGL